jgi:hypothetical protein
MKVLYKKMVELKACITETEVYLYMPGESPKICNISDNVQLTDILRNREDITKADFEAGLNVNTIDFALFKVMYLAAVEPIFDKIARLEANPVWSVSPESPESPY